MTKMAMTKAQRKALRLDEAKLKRAQQILGTETEAETIERALDEIISEDERNRRAWTAHERFIKSALKERIVVRDVYGVLED
jgi:hypothetical protein